MQAPASSPKLSLLMLALAAALSACSGRFDPISAIGNPAPTNYKSDILAFLRSYLNDPTNIRDAALTRPFPVRVGADMRHAVCVRFNARNSAGQYAGVIDTAAVFNAGRLDRFLDLSPDPAAPDAALRAQLREPCQAATYEPFPELQQLTR
jgi:hypothetical protein